MNRNFNKISLRSFPSSYVLRSNDSTQQCMEEWCRLSNRFLGLDMSYIYNEYYFTDHSGKGMVQKKSHLLLSRLLESYIPSSFELTGYPVLDHGICAYTVIGTQKDVPDCGSMEKLFDWADRKCIRLEGTIYSSVRMQMVQDGQKHYYMELYMPICDSSGIPLGKV